MTNLDRYLRGRFRPGPGALGPFAVGALLVVTSIVIGFLIAALTGSLGSRPATAAASIDTFEAAMPGCTDVVPATATVGLASGSEQKAALTFGYLVFEHEFTDGSTMTGFGPLPATACREPVNDENDSAHGSLERSR
jgi:hypothetical protein